MNNHLCPEMQVVNYCHHGHTEIWNTMLLNLMTLKNNDQKCVRQWVHNTQCHSQIGKKRLRTMRQECCQKNVIPQSTSWECAHKIAINTMIPWFNDTVTKNNDCLALYRKMLNNKHINMHIHIVPIMQLKIIADVHESDACNCKW